jgi:hypothetical protein
MEVSGQLHVPAALHSTNVKTMKLPIKVETWHPCDLVRWKVHQCYAMLGPNNMRGDGYIESVQLSLRQLLRKIKKNIYIYDNNMVTVQNILMVTDES